MSEKFIKGLLRIHQVLALVPIGESSWWKGCKEGIYPKPIKLGPRTSSGGKNSTKRAERRFALPPGTPVLAA